MSQRFFTDQLGNKISVPFPPKRIISLVPSQTELLFDLGLDKEIVGITKFCVHPDNWLEKKQIVGGTKNFWFDVIDRLSPDLILGNKEENYQEGVTQLQAKYPVWMSDIVTFDDALEMIRTIGKVTGKGTEGISLVSKIKTAFNLSVVAQNQRTLYLIWRNPWMGIGKHTFIHAMLQKAGFINVLESKDRYPELIDKDIRELNPDVIMLSSEPFPFTEEHMTEVKSIVPNAIVRLVDGEMFSWYGSRLMKAPDYFNSLRGLRP